MTIYVKVTSDQPGEGKSAIAQLIQQTLEAAGFDTSLDRVDSPYIRTPSNQHTCLASIRAASPTIELSEERS